MRRIQEAPQGAVYHGQEDKRPQVLCHEDKEEGSGRQVYRLYPAQLPGLRTERLPAYGENKGVTT